MLVNKKHISTPSTVHLTSYFSNSSLILLSLFAVLLFVATNSKFRPNVLSSTKQSERETVSNLRQKSDQEKVSQDQETKLSGQDNNFKKPVIEVVLILTNAASNSHLKNRFIRCVASIVKHSSVDLQLNIMGDFGSNEIARKAVADIRSENPTKTIKIKTFLVNDVAEKTKSVVEKMQAHFSYKKGAYYNDPLFFLSPTIFKVLPYSKVIMLDSDLVFRSDIADLYNLFSEFKESQILGIAHDQQPVYRHTFYQYRQSNPGTRVGAPPPDGLTGFNSGVLLLDLDRMRQSELYQKMLNPREIEQICERFSFKGHLGDQDFYSVLEMAHPELFYVLPCSWNRQLCQWWRDHGYEDIFDLYFKCDGDGSQNKIHVLHGNCNTPIPED